MAILQPQSTDKLNSPSHSLSHRVFANDNAAPVKKVIVEADGTTKIGDSDGGNSTIIKPDGEINLEGTARVIKQIPIDNANLGKGNTAPTQVIIGNYNSWEFGVNDDVVFTFHLPHDWAIGTDIDVQVDWYIDEAGGDSIKWQIDWSATPHTSTEAIDNPTHTGTDNTGDVVVPGTVKFLTKNIMTISGGDLTMDDQLGVKISRVVAGGVAPSNEPSIIDLHIVYTSDKIGEAT